MISLWSRRYVRAISTELIYLILGMGNVPGPLQYRSAHFRTVRPEWNLWPRLRVSNGLVVDFFAYGIYLG